MASQAYNEWVARIRAAGGRVTVAPSGAVAVAFPNNLRGPVSSQDLATQYSETHRSATNGQVTHYFHAPQWVQIETRSFVEVTWEEQQSAAADLLDSWGIPSPLRGLGNFSSALIWAGIAFVIVAALVLFARRR